MTVDGARLSVDASTVGPTNYPQPPALMSAEEYLAQQPPDRRAALTAVRDVIRANLPNGYEESVQKGMLVYYVPLSRYPDTYNKQPLWLAALGFGAVGIVLLAMAYAA